MLNESITKYKFDTHKASLGVEVVPLEFIFKHSDEGRAHRLDFYQLIFVTEGEGSYEMDFETITYKPGDVIPLIMGQVQRFIPGNKMEGVALIFTPEFLVSQDVDYRYLYEYLIFNHVIEPVILSSNERMWELIHQIKEELALDGGYDSGELLRQYLKGILIHLERSKRGTSHIVCDVSLDIYLKFRKYLEKNLSYSLHLTHICEALNYTPKQLNSVVKLFAKTTAKKYVEDRVILEIKRLLAYSTLSIKEVAYELGFIDPTNFTKYFKARVKMLPNEYQKQIR